MILQRHTSESMSLLLNSLFSQSYHSIAHSFIESITEYQKLQQRYEQLLEKNYSLPSFLDEEENDHIPQKQQIVTNHTHIYSIDSWRNRSSSTC